MSEEADRSIETAGREVQRGITAGADKTVVFWGLCFLVHRNVRRFIKKCTQLTQGSVQQQTNEGTQAHDKLDVVQRDPDPRETNSPVAVTRPSVRRAFAALNGDHNKCVSLLR